MTLGQKLKKLRTEKGLTQKDLADQLHVTFQTVSKWESDTNEPDFSTLKELSKMQTLVAKDLKMERGKCSSYVEAKNIGVEVQESRKRLNIRQHLKGTRSSKLRRSDLRKPWLLRKKLLNTCTNISSGRIMINTNGTSLEIEFQ